MERAISYLQLPLQREENDFYKKLMRLTAEVLTDYGTQLKSNGKYDQCEYFIPEFLSIYEKAYSNYS